MKRLVGFDGTPSPIPAPLPAPALPRGGDDLAVIHVAEHEPKTDREVQKARKLLAGLGIDAVPIAEEGQPARAICVTAEKHAYDTIVVGRRNLHDAGLVLLGSVAARVVA